MARLVMFSEEVGRQRYVDVEYPAWVVTGYPRYVPEILDIVTVDDVVYDLGSGDGRIVIAAAGRGCRAVGVELDGDLVLGQAYFRSAGVEHEVVNDNAFEVVFVETELLTTGDGA